MIVMDLEWNHGTVDKQLLLEGRTLRFEIIQIGAVQVDSLGNICKTFERLVMPCVHRTIMPKVIELTGITDRKLKGQQGFVQVWQDFAAGQGKKSRLFFGETATKLFCFPTCCTTKSTEEKAYRCTICRRCSIVPF